MSPKLKKSSKGSKKEIVEQKETSTTESSNIISDFFSPGYQTTIDVVVEEGPERPYVSLSKFNSDNKLDKLRSPTSFFEYLIVFALLALTFIIRLKYLEYPDSVVFDEVHFGKFAAKYITGTYFFDVHPPLAKMTLALVGYLSGFKGNFLFENIGDFFPESVPYYAMRLFVAVCGSISCVLMYLTLRTSGVKPLIAVFGTLFFIWENSFVTISRYILLDAILILFISFAAFYYKKYQNFSESSFGSFKYLVLTGVFLGLGLASKWVGLFTIAWVGVLCLLRLAFMISDLSTPLTKTTAYASKWGAILLGIPAIIYLLSFQAHFLTLVNDSDGASLLTSEYRSTLKGNSIPSDIIKNVGYGSVVSIKHVNTRGGYLHSHEIYYTTGSEQQQLTLYPHIDTNNDFVVEKYNETSIPLTKFEPLKNGDKIRLRHINTHKRVHSHDHKPPVSVQADWQYEASAYGFEGFEGDPNDDFIVEIDQKASAPGESRDVVNAIETKFRLRHAMTGCLLFSHPVVLPDNNQQEVTCAHSAKEHLTLWQIELNTNEFLTADDQAPETISYPKPGFWGKFIETNKLMWSVNNGFTDSHYYQSDPITWPLLNRGISYWSKDNRQVYLLGNAVTWWLSSATVCVFAGMVLIQIFKYQLSIPIQMESEEINNYVQITEYILGWALHYLPFFLMGRQLFLHHYLPAYYFLIMAFTQLLNLFASKFSQHKRKTLVFISFIVIILGASYQFFETHKNFAYGTPQLKSTCQKNKWLNEWDYSCDILLEDWESYDNMTMSTLEARPEGESVFSTEGAVEVDVEDIQQNSGKKRFIGPDGNEISEEEAMKIIDERGGKILKREEQVHVPGTGVPKVNVPPPAQIAEQAVNPVIADIMNNKGPKKFLDQNGNEIDEAVAMKLINDGGKIYDVQQTVI